MVSADTKFTVTLRLGNKLRVSMSLDKTLAQEHQMTGLLFAIDKLKENSKID